MEEIACKCQTFLSLLSGRRKQASDICFFSIQILKEVSLKILCCHNDTWFHLKLTILKPGDNQSIFLMEMFVLSYANVLYIYHKLCLQVGSAKWLRIYLTNQYVILRYCSPNLCKSEKVGLKLNIQKTKIMGSGPITSWQIDGK